jgi:hypothetical protein
MSFEYKEIVKKNGRILVFCNFEDLLKEVYGVNTMDQVEAVMEKKGTEIIARCPFCKHEHTKSKLYIRDDMTTGWCFLCNRTYINVTDTLNTDVVVPRTFADFGAGPLKFELPEMKNDEWNMDKYYYEFDDESDVGMKYLISRHGFFKDLAKALGFKFWNGNVVMPFMWMGKPYYYQIRFSSKTSKIRYFLPPVSQKSCYIIERRQEEDVMHRILIVEGIYDAIAAMIQCPDYTPVAVLGSSISDYQIAQIREYAGYVSEMMVWMDETQISVRIKKKVRSIIDYCPINIIYSNGEDPEECLQKKLKYGLPLIKHRSEDAIRKEQQRDAELKEQQESWNVGTSDGRGSSEVPSGES